MNTEHLSKEAERLLNDEVLMAAFDAVKAEALDALATADADDKTMILRLQQRVAVVTEIRDVLRGYILRQRSQEQANPFP